MTTSTKAAPQARSPPSDSMTTSSDNEGPNIKENSIEESIKVVDSPQARAIATRSRQSRRRRGGAAQQNSSSPSSPFSSSPILQKEDDKKPLDPKKNVLVPIGDGSEEIETSGITETLSRFGARVVVASVMPDDRLACTMSRGLKVIADTTIQKAAAEEWDLIVLPGGMPGSRFLRQSKDLMDLLDRQNEKKKLFGAICTSPAVVLATAGLVEDGATCYPARILREKIKDASDEDVVVQDNVITSQGPGTSLLFALRLGEELYGKEKADEISKEMLVDRDGLPSYTVRLLPSAPVSNVNAKSLESGRKRPLENGTKVPPGASKKVCKESEGASSLPVLLGKDSAKTLKELYLFQGIVWTRLLKLGWRFEKGARKQDNYYVPPGITRGKGMTCRKDYFDSRVGVLKYIENHGGEGRKVYDFFMECLSVGKELIQKKQLHKDFETDFLEEETIRRRGGPDLFHHIVWDRLSKMGWKCDREGKGKKPAVMYIPPGVTGAKSQWIVGKHYFDSQMHVLDFLDESEEWGSKDSILKIRELYNACLKVQKEHIMANDKSVEDLTAEWIETETKKRKPYLASY